MSQLYSCRYWNCSQLDAAHSIMPLQLSQQKLKIQQVCKFVLIGATVELSVLHFLWPGMPEPTEIYFAWQLEVLENEPELCRPLIDLLGSSNVFPSLLLISIWILSDQLSCPGTWLHWECSNGFFHLDVSTTSFLKVAVRAIQSGSVCSEGTSTVWAFVDVAF